MVTFTVLGGVMRHRPVRGGRTVNMCLGCSLYVLWRWKRVPPSVDAYRRKRPTCVRLVRGVAELRRATEADLAAVGVTAAAAAGGTSRLLYVRGEELQRSRAAPRWAS